MEPRHLDQMFDLFNLYMEKYNLHPIFTQDEFKEKFSNKLITCYVLESDDGDVLDFVSYYLMQSRVLKACEKHEFIRKACLYYYTSVNATPFSLISDLLIVAKNNDIHVFDALDIMENANVISELGFDEGTGFLHYYLYNWKVKPLKNIQCSWIMI
jgi:glycylpeptide N-tetradecanoyltransferase